MHAARLPASKNMGKARFGWDSLAGALIPAAERRPKIRQASVPAAIVSAARALRANCHAEYQYRWSFGRVVDNGIFISL